MAAVLVENPFQAAAKLRVLPRIWMGAIAAAGQVFARLTGITHHRHRAP